MKKTFTCSVLLSFLLILTACAQTSSYNYLALGDSYTIGEAVHEDLRWPNILTDSLEKNGYDISRPKIIATTGWTTNELLDALKKEKPTTNNKLVSLLIGVNNQYRAYPINQYKKEFKILLEKAIQYADGKPENVFVVSIPNYGVTPFGMTKGESKIRKELLEYDTIAESIASDYGVPFVNITPVSEKAKKDKSYIASDELHPSGKQYKEWVDLIYPIAKRILDNQSDN